MEKNSPLIYKETKIFYVKMWKIGQQVKVSA